MQYTISDANSLVFTYGFHCEIRDHGRYLPLQYLNATLELQRNAMDIDTDHICKHQLFGYILIPQ